MLFQSSSAGGKGEFDRHRIQVLGLITKTFDLSLVNIDLSLIISEAYDKRVNLR